MAAVMEKTSINEIMLDRLTQAKRAVVVLKRDGYTVIGIDMSISMPTIQIQTCAGCRRLIEEGKAVYYRFQSTNGVHERFAQFSLNNCKVMWIERGN